MLEINMISYEAITCPKCGKKHFKKIREPNWAFADIFVIEPELIYKDGILQNPSKPEPTKESFKCLECGCNFRVEYFDVNNFKVIDVDLEIEKTKEEMQKRFEQNVKDVQVASTLMTADDANKLLTVGASNEVELTLSDNVIKRDEFESKFADLELQVKDLQMKVNQLKTDMLFK